MYNKELEKLLQYDFNDNSNYIDIQGIVEDELTSLWICVDGGEDTPHETLKNIEDKTTSIKNYVNQFIKDIGDQPHLNFNTRSMTDKLELQYGISPDVISIVIGAIVDEIKGNK